MVINTINYTVEPSLPPSRTSSLVSIVSRRTCTAHELASRNILMLHESILGQINIAATPVLISILGVSVVLRIITLVVRPSVVTVCSIGRSMALKQGIVA